MRQIGHLKDEKQARTFGDFLVARGIKNDVEHESDGSWSIWVRDEDQVSEAAGALERFSASPDSAEFRAAADEAARVRAAEAQSLAEYRKRVRAGRNLFPKMGGFGVGLLTYALIVACVIVAIYTKLGNDEDALRNFFISDPVLASGFSLHDVFAGQIWRLITPIFIHFGLLHIVFNMMWLYQLGCMIEARQGSGKLLALVVVVGVVSNLAQYYVSGSPTFGGMSGVVYGLAGYVWMRGKYDRGSGLYLDPQSVTILLIWLVVCFSNLMGPVANWAHLGGLLVGVVWGRVSA